MQVMRISYNLYCNNENRFAVFKTFTYKYREREKISCNITSILQEIRIDLKKDFRNISKHRA